MIVPDLVCWCGRYYRFEGDIGVCQRCGEYASVTTVSPDEQQQMRDELDLVVTAHEQSVSVEGSAERRSELGLEPRGKG
jgi:hypothetical protein